MKWIYPAASHNITCGFYCYANHDADDFGCYFEPFWAARDGTVMTVQTPDRAHWSNTGWYIEVRHDDGWITRYFHLSRIDVAVGQRVTQGQQMGVTGNTGFDAAGDQYAPHLHFAMHAPTEAEALTVWENPHYHVNGWAVDPAWVIEHQQQEDEDMALTQDVIDRFDRIEKLLGFGVFFDGDIASTDFANAANLPGWLKRHDTVEGDAHDALAILKRIVGADDNIWLAYQARTLSRMLKAAIKTLKLSPDPASIALNLALQAAADEADRVDAEQMAAAKAEGG